MRYLSLHTHTRAGFLLAVAALCLAATSSISTAQEPSSLSETFGSWVVQCQMASGSEEGSTQRICQVSQELRKSDTGKRVISAVLTTEPYKITLVTPFGLLLTEGVKLSADEKELPGGTFTTCLASVGCVAESILDAEELSTLQSSETLTVLMVNAKGQKVQANLSLDGFGDAAKRLGTFQ